MTPDGDLYAPDLASTLEIEEIDTNLYRARNAASAARRRALYGGQVAAQALKAAGMTVDPDRNPHSLHGYFLRPGRVDRPVILKVDRDRDGGSFSARHVAAVQDGEVIFSMLASFHRDDTVDALDEMPPSDLPDPETLGLRDVDSLIDIREVTKWEVVDGIELHPDCMWLRSRSPLPDDALTQACGLVYLSDFGSGFGRTGATVGTGGSSLDHAVWFHAPARADGWVLSHMWPMKATGMRGLYRAAMRNPDGRLVAVVTQENLLRKQTGKG